MNRAYILLAALLGACGSSAPAGRGGSSTSASTSGSTGTTGSASTTTTGGGTTGTSTTTTGGGSTSGGGVADPNLDGPYAAQELDDTIASVAGGDSNLAVHCAYPASGPGAGPYPVVVVAHGFQIAASEYAAYLHRLATFGYVALTVDYPTSFSGQDDPAQARDLLAGIDWAAGQSALHADPATAGMTGHSLGGKLALYAAMLDPRVKASIVLDPVDGSTGSCNPPACQDVSSQMAGLQIPTGLLGETTDATGSFQACAPAADNYATFFAAANAPSLEVTVLGANHMSFLDDVSACGLVCSFCNPATAPNAQVHALAMSYVVAFYERYLRGNSGYEAYLTGAFAQARYVSTGQATLSVK